MSDKLLPCPFCGSTKLHVEKYTVDDVRGVVIHIHAEVVL
jgi:hypothetical protein